MRLRMVLSAAIVALGIAVAVQLMPSRQPTVNRPDPGAVPASTTSPQPRGGPYYVAQSLHDRAIGVALSSPDTRSRLQGRRYRAIMVDNYGPLTSADKPESDDPCLSRACLVVDIYDYTGGRSLRVFIERENWQPVRWQFTGPTLGPPLNHEEQDLAHFISDSDPQIQAIVGGEHTHLRPPYPGNSTSGSCATHRCAIVFYNRPGGGKLLSFVDLVTEVVAWHLDRPAS